MTAMGAPVAERDDGFERTPPEHSGDNRQPGAGGGNQHPAGHHHGRDREQRDQRGQGRRDRPAEQAGLAPHQRTDHHQTHRHDRRERAKLRAFRRGPGAPDPRCRPGPRRRTKLRALRRGTGTHRYSTHRGGTCRTGTRRGSTRRSSTHRGGIRRIGIRRIGTRRGSTHRGNIRRTGTRHDRTRRGGIAGHGRTPVPEDEELNLQHRGRRPRPPGRSLEPDSGEHDEDEADPPRMCTVERHSKSLRIHRPVIQARDAAHAALQPRRRRPKQAECTDGARGRDSRGTPASKTKPEPRLPRHGIGSRTTSPGSRDWAAWTVVKAVVIRYARTTLPGSHPPPAGPFPPSSSFGSARHSLKIRASQRRQMPRSRRSNTAPIASALERKRFSSPISSR